MSWTVKFINLLKTEWLTNMEFILSSEDVHIFTISRCHTIRMFYNMNTTIWAVLISLQYQNIDLEPNRYRVIYTYHKVTLDRRVWFLSAEFLGLFRTFRWLTPGKSALGLWVPSSLWRQGDATYPRRQRWPYIPLTQTIPIEPSKIEIIWEKKSLKII